MIHHIKRATRHLIFWSLIVAAIGLTGARLLLSGIEHYKADLASHIGELVGTPVTIGRLGAKMRGFNPQLVLKDIAISSRGLSPSPSGATPTNPLQADLSSLAAGHEKPAIEFTEIRLGIHFLELLVSRDLWSSSWVTLVGAKLVVKRQLDGSIVIVGLKASDGRPQWLLQGGKYEVLHSEIIWQDEKIPGRPLLFKQVDLAISNEGEHHRLNMLIKLPKNIGDTLSVSMDFNGNVFEPETLRGRVYIDGKAVELAELAASLGLAQPETSQANRRLSQAAAQNPIHIKSGVGDFKIWADWGQSQQLSMEIEAKIQQLALVRQGKPEFFANELNTRLHWAASDNLREASRQWRLDVSDFLLEADLAGLGFGTKRNTHVIGRVL